MNKWKRDLLIVAGVLLIGVPALWYGTFVAAIGWITWKNIQVEEGVLTENEKPIREKEDGYGWAEDLLANTRFGVWCVARLSFQGTRSNWQYCAVLNLSPLKEDVVREMTRVAESPSESRVRRVAANEILWSRTKDVRYLVAIYRLVRTRGESIYRLSGARRNLAQIVDDPDFENLVMASQDKLSNIEMSEEDFEALVRKLKPVARNLFQE